MRALHSTFLLTIHVDCVHHLPLLITLYDPYKPVAGAPCPPPLTSLPISSQWPSCPLSKSLSHPQRQRLWAAGTVLNVGQRYETKACIIWTLPCTLLSHAPSPSPLSQSLSPETAALASRQWAPYPSPNTPSVLHAHTHLSVPHLSPQTQTEKGAYVVGTGPVLGQPETNTETSAWITGSPPHAPLWPPGVWGTPRMRCHSAAPPLVRPAHCGQIAQC